MCVYIILTSPNIRPSTITKISKVSLIRKFMDIRGLEKICLKFIATLKCKKIIVLLLILRK